MLREIKTIADGTAFLECNERQTKTRAGVDLKDALAVNPKTFAVEGSERDPVRAYNLYASKRSDAILWAQERTKSGQLKHILYIIIYI